MALKFDQLNHSGNLTQDTPFVGVFHCGKGAKDNKGLEGLPSFRITSDDRELLVKVVALLGSDAVPQRWDNGKREMRWEMLTDIDYLEISFEKPENMWTRFFVWSRRKTVKTCEGSDYFSAHNTPLDCHRRDFKDWESHSAAGHTCQPRSTLRFRLVGAPELGVFEFQANAWSLAMAVPKMRKAIREGRTTALLVLEQSRWNGKEFLKPILKPL